MDVAIVDYGAGNHCSVKNALIQAGATPSVAATPEAILAADRLVLPGVGNAHIALENMRGRGLDQALEDAVRRRARPLFCICLGLQMLAETLHEGGASRGLGWIGGEVVDLSTCLPADARVPHMGWNQLTVSPSGEPFFAEVRGAREFYFCHSFALRTQDTTAVVATADYFGPIVAALCFDTVLATQFHPEKSQLNGHRVIEAFLGWSP